MTRQLDPMCISSRNEAPFLERLKESIDAIRLHVESKKAEQDRWHPLARFRQILATAREIAQLNPRALPDLIRAVLRPMQSEYLLGVAELGRDPYPSIDADKFFSPVVSRRLYLPDGSTWRGKEVPTDHICLSLARDIVLPCAWNVQRYVGAFACIGKEKFEDRDTAWRQDDNHGVTLWLPWGIGFVSGGNHSITAGILAGEGFIRPGEAYDMNYLLDELTCDGLHYGCAKSGERLAPVADPRIAAVFEIGRLMRDHGVVPRFEAKELAGKG